MNLKKKKRLIAKVLNIGIDRIILDSNAKEEIKEAITRQDIRDLKKQGIIKIKETRGVKRKPRKKRRSFGSIEKIVKKRKAYIKLTRKLRAYIKNLKKGGKLNKEQYKNFRKRVKMREFKELSHLRAALRIAK